MGPQSYVYVQRGPGQTAFNRCGVGMWGGVRSATNCAGVSAARSMGVNAEQQRYVMAVGGTAR